MQPDFSGYATKANIKCSDGRTILPDAFKDCDGNTVPLVWQHGHNNVDNVLGHAKLENRDDGVYAYGFFNESNAAKNAMQAVKHKDVTSMSIYANQLQQDGGNVRHGVIREVSLVLSGANPEARIDNVYIKHSDGYREELEDEAVIYSGELMHSDQSGNATPQKEENKSEDKEESSDSKEETIQDVLDSMTPKQLEVTEYLVGLAAGEDKEEKEEENNQSDDKSNQSAQHSDTTPEGETMNRNVFEKNGGEAKQHKASDNVLSHSEIKSIFEDAQNNTKSLHQSILAHAESKGYGVDNIEFLFPEAKALQDTPEFISRQMDWVNDVLSGAKKVPFSRIKTVYADITHDEARAKGYITGNMKKEEYFGLAKRETHPTTIYKKQKLDRDDIIDVTTMDIVAWLWAEMRVMLNEEIARAILFGDGRDVDDEDKIDEKKIRPIATDHEFFTHKIFVKKDIKAEEMVEAVIRAKKYYKGSGNLTLFTSEDLITEMLLEKDQLGRRLYADEGALRSALRVNKIVTTDILDPDTMDPKSRIAGLRAILVNMNDYVIGTDKGGEITRFDDFDIDYNQYKYLLEGRMSGSLTKRKSAIAIWEDGTFEEDGDNIEPSDFSQQLDPRSNHPKFRPGKDGKKPSDGGSTNPKPGNPGAGDTD